MAAFANIPKVDKLLAEPAFQLLQQTYPYPLLLKTLRSVLESIRADIRAGHFQQDAITSELLLATVTDGLQRAAAPSLRRVINATGTIIHTNLGRSPLPAKIARHLADIATHYCNLELDTCSGERGDRHLHVEPLICELAGAEAALVVNNNAAALLLALSALARGKEVIVSRGELVEIGGSFRIPEIMEQSGARLREVGTTNRTHLKDYRKGINAETALLLKVSCSNFAMIGFTAEVGVKELVGLGRETGTPVMVDAGSGALIDLEPLLGCRETTVRKYLDEGADLVVFSGDKLLGGSQVGIIAGRRELVEPLKKHPLLRALRLDKTALAALEATLQLYRDERSVLREIPTLRMLTMTPAELGKRAGKLLRMARRRASDGVRLQLLDGFSAVGGGSLPALQLPTRLVAVTSSRLSAESIDKVLRSFETPVIARIAKGALLLDVRTLLDDDFELVAKAVGSL